MIVGKSISVDDNFRLELFQLFQEFENRIIENFSISMFLSSNLH